MEVDVADEPPPDGSALEEHPERPCPSPPLLLPCRTSQAKSRKPERGKVDAIDLMTTLSHQPAPIYVESKT